MGFWEGAGKVAKEIATGIWGDGAAKALKSNLNEIGRSRVRQVEAGAAEDLISTMSSNGIKFDEEGIGAVRDLLKENQLYSRDTLAPLIEKASIDGDMNQKVIEEAINKYKDDGAKLRTFLDNKGSASAASEYLGKKDNALGPWNMAAGYFGDVEKGATRKKVVAAGVAGTGLGIRFLSGGNLTTNAQGERDIAGIPFV